MNSFHEHAYHHHHHDPRDRLLLSPPEPHGPVQLRTTLGIAFFAVFFVATCCIILNSIHNCLERRRRLRDLRAPTDNRNITIDIVPGESTDAQLRAIPVLVFGSASSPSSNGGGVTEEKESCSVCLAEYVEGEEVRVLPRCKHMFHKACIDQWLLTRSPFCPICRDRVIERDASGNGDESNRNTSALRVLLEVRVNMAPYPLVPPFSL